jgi:polar amino acid transport system substrate-binding protein
MVVSKRRCVFMLGLAALLGLPGPLAAQTAEAARAALPDSVRAAGVLRVATSLQWPPFAYVSAAGAPDGIDIRLMRLLAEKLGLRPEIEDVKFPSIVPGVANGRFDAGVDQINITAERGKVVDFVPYSKDAMGLLVRKGASGIDVNSICGRTLVLTQGSAQVGIADRLSAKCVADGHKAIASLLYPNSADTYLALANGRGEGFLTGRAVGVYIAKTNDRLAMTDATLPDLITVSGIVVAKGNTAMRNALRLALESAVADGSYQKIFAEFGVPDGALDLEQIRNPPPI